MPTVSGFQLFNKTSRSLLGTFAAGTEGKALTVSGDYVYLAAADGLRVVDVQNEAAPSQVGVLPLPPGEFEPIDVQLLGDHACMVFKKTNLLMVVDVSTPTAPEWVGSYGFTGPARDLSVCDGHALIVAADTPASSSDLHVIDLSTPTNPTLASRLYAAGRSLELALQDGMLFTADGGNGLCILNAETPATLELVGHQVAPADCLTVAADWVFLGSGSGFQVYDVSVPGTPALVTNSWEPTFQLDAKGDYLYRIGGYGMPELVIMDFNNNFAEVDKLPWIQGVGQVGPFGMAGNHFVLLVDPWQGNLVIIDVQTSGLPIITNYLSDAKIVDVVGQANGSGTNAFLATTNGLEILDLDDTNNIVRLAAWDCPPGYVPSCICVDGDRIGLASPDHLWVIDRNQLGGGDPVIAETDIGVSLMDMILSGNKIYAATGKDGVIVYEIGTAPPQPRLFIADRPPDQVTVQWAAAGTGWLLQQTQDPGVPGGWQPVPGSDGVTSTNLPRTATSQFFRLSQP